MTHPHVGSDNLKLIVKNLRKKYAGLGGEIRFEKTLFKLSVTDGKVSGSNYGR